MSENETRDECETPQNIVDLLFEDSYRNLCGISQKSDKCVGIVESMYSKMKHEKVEDMSDVSRLRVFLLLKYLCNICVFVRSKITGDSGKMDDILANLAKSVIEIDKTRFLNHKKRTVEKLIRDANAAIVSSKETTTSAPRLKNLLPKVRDFGDGDSEGEINSKYKPPKDKFVPYPLDKKQKAPKKSSLKSLAVLEMVGSNTQNPEEFKFDDESEFVKQKNVKQTIDQRLRYMEDDEELEHLTNSTNPRKRKKTLMKRKKERKQFRKKNKTRY
ncbi:hypothetical protein RF11_08827 [Thelohanellus kitauei]|uniref:Neuroguidin n=1 Tax=Thelohanellus kitauei TaxID=669202 RepID=A0A0C2IXZ5_THEKT|nr:hypothetical protein RF11_08827 [Thelohanellus kitauei]